MERELWKEIYALARSLDKKIWTWGYPAADIVGVFLWAVIRDRPVLWACDERNWPDDLIKCFRYGIPPQYTVSRRLRSKIVQQLLQDMIEVLSEPMEASWVKIVDSKPLTVGTYSKDKDAKWGKCGDGYARGYKLHAIVGSSPVPLVWSLELMNIHDSKAVEKLIPELSGGGYLLGDSAYDMNRLYDRAYAKGHQLVAPRQRPNAGLGHIRHSPARLRSIELLKGQFGKDLYKQRTHIERCFGWLTSFGGGLAPLPSWVRRPWRVANWVKGKIMVHAIRWTNRKDKMLATA